MTQTTTKSGSAGRSSLVILCLLSTLVASLAAQEPASEGSPSDTQTLVLERTASQVRLAFPAAEYEGLTGEDLEAAREIEQTLRDDLEQDFLFNVQGPTELSVLTLSGVRDQDFEQYRSLGNEVVLFASLHKDGDKLVLDGRTYDLPSRQSVLGKRFRGSRSQARLVAHSMADALHYQFAARPSIVLTTIAFQSDRSGFQELYLMDYDGHNQRRISGHKSTSGYSDWSPKGDAIAYMSYFSGTPGIYYVDLASGNKVPVFREPPLSLSPSFSPDGRRIAFAHSRGSNIDIYVCDRDCRQPQRVTTSGAIDTNPAWSPDGRQLAFTSGRSGQPQIYVMQANGDNVRRISFEGDYNEGAAWRPDGTHLAYASRAKDRRRFQIAVTSLVDLTTRIVASGRDSYEEPSYSPDGQKIVFTVKRGVEAQIFSMDADGGNLRQLTHEGNNTGGDWSGFPSR